MGKSWNDIPDLDAGRIPFPISSRGRYALGERKTAVVVFLGLFPLRDEQRMLDSILSVLNSKENRVYVDMVAALYDDSRESDFKSWSNLLLNTNEDCQVLTVKRTKQIRNAKGDRYNLREELLNVLEAANYEQVLVILVPFILLFDV